MGHANIFSVIFFSFFLNFRGKNLLHVLLHSCNNRAKYIAAGGKFGGFLLSDPIPIAREESVIGSVVAGANLSVIKSVMYNITGP